MGEEAFGLFRDAGDPHGMAESLAILGWCEIDQLVQQKFFKEQLAVEEANGDIDGIAQAFNNVAANYYMMFDYENAIIAHQASREHYRQVGNNYWVAQTGRYLATMSHYNGNMESANEYLDQALADSRAIANEKLMFDCLGWKIMIAFTLGRYEKVEQYIEESTLVAQKYGTPAFFTDELYHRARLARHRGDPASARQLAEAGLAGRGEMWVPRVFMIVELSYLALQVGDLVRVVELCHEGLHEIINRYEPLWLYWMLDVLVALAVREKKMEHAARLFGTRMWRGFANLLSPLERAERTADLSEVKAFLNEERYVALQEEGSAMTFMQILALVQEELKARE